MTNNWQVITGAFASGKTTLLAGLGRRGYRTVPEAARDLIDEELAGGLTIAEIRADEEDFQQRVLRRKIEIEQHLPKDELIFFDRGIPDTLAYMRLYGFAEAEAMKAGKQANYGRVIILDPLPYMADYARTENHEQIAELDRLLESVYRELGHDVVRVPATPVRKRIEIILGTQEPA